MEHPEVYGPDHAHPDGLARAKAAMDAASKQDLNLASIALTVAARYCSSAVEFDSIGDIRRRRTMIAGTVSMVSVAAAALGYDLVKRDD